MMALIKHSSKNNVQNVFSSSSTFRNIKIQSSRIDLYGRSFTFSLQLAIVPLTLGKNVYLSHYSPSARKSTAQRTFKRVEMTDSDQ